MIWKSRIWMQWILSKKTVMQFVSIYTFTFRKSRELRYEEKIKPLKKMKKKKSEKNKRQTHLMSSTVKVNEIFDSFLSFRMRLVFTVNISYFAFILGGSSILTHLSIRDVKHSRESICARDKKNS